MRYTKPKYYDDFQCVAGDCPDTCCAGWQIVIDEGSLERYGEVTGAFGNRLKNSIDWMEGAFCQYDKKCAFLNRDNLCDLYGELGEEALCDTCRNYPRHVEEYDGLRELSLSLSCPVAAGMILECREPFGFLEKVTEEEEEFWEEFEDFDILLFTRLEDAREVIWQIISASGLSQESRMEMILQMAEQMQQCLEDNRSCDMDSVLECFRDRIEGDFVRQSRRKSVYFRNRKESFGVLERLERLREEWQQILDDTWNTLYARGEEEYLACREAFESYIAENFSENWERIWSNLMVFFFYTYFSGAVYDDGIYGKAALSVCSVSWIQELLMARWKIQGETLEWEDCVDIVYRYAREIEHSDNNLNALEEWLTDERGREE